LKTTLLAGTCTAIKNRFFYGYWIVLAGFITLVLSMGLVFYGFMVLNKPIGDEFGWSRGEVTAAGSIFLIAMAFTSPLVGRFTDRRGPRQVLIFGTILMAFSLILLSLISDLWSYYLLHLCLGAGIAILGPIPVSIMVYNWFYRLRGLMQGLAFIGIGFGGLVMGPLIGNYLIPNLGWRNTYLAMALLLLVIMLPLIFFIVRDRPQQKGVLPYGQEAADTPTNIETELETAGGLTLRQSMGKFTFWIVALTAAIYGMSMVGTLQNQVSILTEQEYAATSAVAAVGMVGLFSGLGKAIFGYLCDRIDPKYAAAIAYALIAFSIITIVQSRSMASLWLYAALMGLGQGGWAPNLSMLAVKYFGRKHYGTVLGAIHLIFISGEAVGPIIVGFTYDQTGSYRLVLTVLAGLCLAAIPIVAMIRKSEQH